jgi:crotonobetainyl-CoA:carnitine CoA-transferase CaiB-like acyl-CoA transferase
VSGQFPGALGGSAPLEGVKVVELGRFAAGPSCATVLADWGADVIKLEPPTGDPARGASAIAEAGRPPVNPRFEVHNRTRRSLALDISTPEGLSVLHRLLTDTDVFVTNLRPDALRHLGVDSGTLRAFHPRLITAQVSGYGQDTDLADQRSYDHGAFWAYSGVASLFASGGGEPPQPTGGFGDRAAGTALAGGIAAALFARERTGRGQHVATSLVNTALWLMASDLSDAVATGRTHRSPQRADAPIPTLNCYRTADARWLWLQVMTPATQWDALLGALDARWLDADPRFRGGSADRLRMSGRQLTELLDAIFAERTLEEWVTRLDRHGITCAPVRSLDDVAFDDSLRASAAFVGYPGDGGQQQLSVNSPCQFDGSAPVAATRAPALGEHTIEILTALGLAPADIEALRRSGTLGAALAVDQRAV